MSDQDNVKATKKKDGFVMYRSYYDPISGLSNEQLGILLRLIFEWQISTPNDDWLDSKNLDPMVKMAMAFFIKQFRIDDGKYVEKCSRMSENANRRWQGNRSNDAIGCNCIPDEQLDANDADNDKDKVNDKEKDKDNVFIDKDKDPRTNELIYPFQDDSFRKAFDKLIHTPKWKERTSDELNDVLDQISGYDVQYVTAKVKQCADAGWPILVKTPDWDKDYDGWKKLHPSGPGKSKPKPITNVNDLGY